MSHLEQEIASQPNGIRTLLAEETDNVGKIAAAVRRFQPSYVYIAARGTSDNAARYAHYLMGVFNRLAVGLAAPSLHTLYEAPPDLSKALVIGISQSGKSVDVMQVVIDARKQGALTLSITNDASSPMAEAAEYHIPLHAGEELSVAATKTYTAELTAVAMLVAALADSDELRTGLQHLPELAGETLAMSGDIARWSERYRYISQFVSIGRGFNYCTAFEISLKVKELCYITGNGYSEADFLHGPIAQVQPGFPVVVVTPAGKTFAVMQDFLQKLKDRQAEALVISNEESAFATAHQSMRLPTNLPEWLSPIVAVMPGQIFAMNLAIARGNPVDNPRGLTKVTVTR
ncbi:MAG TPA: SIS domain-containing protein [Phototrophicaceae bacterium]|jgi:glucosamine--fructose-6-phosphate aminotransferase (isomerizing)|nr:SIS domain-containing protein [Phototrophicaceae bacterium]